MPTKPRSINILTSIIGYGVYFPALLVSKQLEKAGIQSKLYIFENFLYPEKQKTFRDSRNAFSKNFRLAQLATKVPVDYLASLDPSLIQEVYTEWAENERSAFLCFSGLWFDVLNSYPSIKSGHTIQCCRMDAGNANTWSNKNHLPIDRSYSFFNLTNLKIQYMFSIPAFTVSNYSRRRHEVVVHGGGWALGDFIQKTECLKEPDFTRKIIIKNLDDYHPDQMNVRFFMHDPEWDPLIQKKERYDFPSLGAVSDQNKLDYMEATDYHAVLNLMNESIAIISKPGGMTLADAIMTETPFIYLKAMGENEEGNKELIEQNKIGTSFESWESTGFSKTLLTEFHHNIRQLKKEIPDFINSYLKDNILTL